MKSNLFIIISTIVAAFVFQSAAPSVAVKDDAGLYKALSNGDKSMAQQIARDHHANKVLSQIIDYQLAGDMTSLRNLSHVCRDEAFEAGAVGTSLTCNQTAAGVAAYSGDMYGLLSDMLWFKKIGFPAIAKKNGAAPRFGNVFDQMDIERTMEETPPLQVSFASDDGALSITNYQKIANFGELPEVGIKINGVEVEANVDTGLSRPIYMSEPDAIRLGLRHIISGISTPHHIYDGVGNKAAQGSMYLAKEVVMGPMTAHNLTVIVTDNKADVNGKIVIGLPMLSKFGFVEFQKNDLYLSKSGGGQCNNRVPLVMAFTSNGSGVYLFEAEHEGSAIRVALDTGSNIYLTGNRLTGGGGAGGYSSQIRLGESKYVSAERIPIAIHVGSAEMDSLSAPSMAYLDSPASVLIGAPVLRKMNVALDFSKPTICFSKLK